MRLKWLMEPTPVFMKSSRETQRRALFRSILNGRPAQGSPCSNCCCRPEGHHGCDQADVGPLQRVWRGNRAADTFRASCTSSSRLSGCLRGTASRILLSASHAPNHVRPLRLP